MGTTALDASEGVDDDGDSVYLSYELYYGTDPDDADTDGDGWDDWSEIAYGRPMGTNALDASEGIDDDVYLSYELSYGTDPDDPDDPDDADTDGDGADDWTEIAYGYDALDPTVHP